MFMLRSEPAIEWLENVPFLKGVPLCATFSI